LHLRAVVLPDGSPLADRCEQVPGEPIADVVGRALVAEAAEVAERAGRRREVAHGERSRFRLPAPAVAAGVVGDAVRALDVDLPLRMVGTDVARVVRLGLARLLQAELVPQVAAPALPR